MKWPVCRFCVSVYCENCRAKSVVVLDKDVLVLDDSIRILNVCSECGARTGRVFDEKYIKSKWGTEVVG